LGIADDVVEEGIRQQRGLEAAKDFLRQEKPEWFPPRLLDQDQA
jgi:hypothetical protein